jgi:CBS-domain-containing membrane protein
MRPPTDSDPTDAPTVRADTRLDALIPLTAVGAGRLRVVDEEERVIGMVDRPGLMAALAG